ncbi:MAG TPA: hypothetical protein PK535_11015 [Synergistaceae bacterium]|nr:hypothetical protein [Synergistaceae bacterium]
MRTALGLMALVLAVVRADPLDTAGDFMDALARHDGARVSEMLSESLDMRFREIFAQLRMLEAENPEMLEAALSRLRGGITTGDIASLTEEELLGRLLEASAFTHPGEPEREHVLLEGRDASVVLDYPGGGSVSFRMIWEDGCWRIADTSLLRMLF